MANRADGPAPLWRPLPISQTQFSYYVEALGLPKEAHIVCEQLGPLGHMDPSLADWAWNFLGLEVDPTPPDTPPSYPFLWLRTAPDHVAQVQVWLWQIYRLGSPVWAEIRWHPAHGATVTFVNLSADASTRRRQLADLDRAVTRTMVASRRGRPLHSGKTRGRSHEALLAEVIEIVQAYWRQGVRPTQDAVLRLLSVEGLDDRGLRRVVTGQTGLNWDLFVEKYRPR